MTVGELGLYVNEMTECQNHSASVKAKVDTSVMSTLATGNGILLSSMETNVLIVSVVSFWRKARFVCSL